MPVFFCFFLVVVLCFLALLGIRTFSPNCLLHADNVAGLGLGLPVRYIYSP